MKSHSYVMTERARTTAETGERIVDAALDLFVELPFAQLSLRAVAERAGVTVQTVIRRFGDKEGLVAAAVERAMTDVSAQRGGAPVGDVEAAVEILVTHYEEKGRLTLKMLGEEESTPPIAVLAVRGRAYHREWCTRVFSPFLAPLPGAERTRRLAQLVAVCDVYTWKLLRHDAGLSRRQVTTALLEMLFALTTKGL